MTMPCECACAGKIVHLQAGFERLQDKVGRLERDVARETIDRADAIRSLRVGSRTFLEASIADLRAGLESTRYEELSRENVEQLRGLLDLLKDAL